MIRLFNIRRVLIADPAIHSLGGHHYVAMERLAAELHELSISFTSLGAASADDYVCKELGVRRCFSESIYGRTDWTVTEFRRRAKVMARELELAARWQWPDLVILPTCDQVVAKALALAIGRSRTTWKPRVLLWLLFPPEREGAVDEYREAFSSLRVAIGDDSKIHVCCETDGMREAFVDATGLSIETRPGPGIAIPPNTLRPVRTGQPIVASIGHANAAKGYRLLPQAIAMAIRNDPRPSFRIQGSINDRDVESDLASFDRLAILGPRVEVTARPLSTLEYRAFFETADILLLPYDPAIYRIRGSGIFNEATLAGKPAIVTAGCGFAERAFLEGRAVAISKLEGGAIAEAIHHAVDRFAALAQQAASCARQQQTNSLRSLLEALAAPDTTA